MRYLPRALKPLLIDLWYGFLVPIFSLFSFLSLLVKPFSLALYFKIQFFLIKSLNWILVPLSKRLQEIRSFSKNLDHYWATYDAEGLDLYSAALQDPDWFIHKNILDVGTGVGHKSYDLARLGATRVVGVDTSKRDIDVAKKMNPPSPNLEFRNVEVKELVSEFKDAFDYIISFTVFEHVSDVELLLNQLAVLQKPGGRNVIVFNHFRDKFGSHLKEYIYHPWPQNIFPEEVLYSYWNQQLRFDQQHGNMGYFPNDYRHGIAEHNNDCYMNLNKISIDCFRSIVKRTTYLIEREYHYSASLWLTVFPQLKTTTLGSYLAGSVVYILQKPYAK